MEISFYPKRPKGDKETTLFARISYEGYKIKYYIPEKINPKFWNKETQRAKETQKFKEFPEFNTRLSNIERDCKNVYRRYLNDGGNIPTPTTLKLLLDKEIKKKEPEKEGSKTFFEFFDEIINQSKKGVRLNPKTGKPISKNTIKTYVTTFKHLSQFQNNYKSKIAFNAIDFNFYRDYTEYLINQLNLSTNTVGKHIQIIKLLLNEATERGLNANLSFKSKRFVTVREKSDSIYLSENEIRELESLDISNIPRLEKVRDLFLIGCRTGLRYSDYSILKPENIKDGYIETIQIKTEEPVVIPIHTTVQGIIEKYKGELPRSISNQKTNEYLKELGEMLPSLNLVTSKTFTKGGVKLMKNYQKWELLSTHTARRSFCTNEFLAGTPVLTIMAISGHKTEKAFLRYIKITPSGHAKLLKQHWEHRGKLQAV